MDIKITEAVTLNQICNKLLQESFGAKLNYKIIQLLNITKPHQEFYVSELKKILSKYSETDEAGNPKMENNSFVIKEGFHSQAQAEIDELESIDVTLAQDIEFTFEEIDKLGLTVYQQQVFDPLILKD